MGMIRMQAQLRHSIAQATKTGWILDCDTTVKVLYGHQDGAVVSYNPQKLGRPSHIIHTYWIGKRTAAIKPQDSFNKCLKAPFGARHTESIAASGPHLELIGLEQEMGSLRPFGTAVC